MLNETGGYGDVVRSNWAVTASNDACIFLISGLSWSGVLFLFTGHMNPLAVTINYMFERVDIFTIDGMSHSA